MVSLSLFFMLIDFRIDLQNQLYAAVAFGVILNQKFILGFDKFFFAFNGLIYSFSFLTLDNDLVIASMISLKVVSALLPGIGAYKRAAKTVVMVVINNVQHKSLEEIVFTSDPQPLSIVDNTFTVLGSTFSRRKIY